MLLSFIASLSKTGPPAPVDNALYVVFDIGQSNSIGRAEANRLALTPYSATPENVQVYYKTSTDTTDNGTWQPLQAGVNTTEPNLPTSYNVFGAEVSLGTKIAERVGAAYFIKAGDGGTPLATDAGLDWNADSANELLDIALQRYWTVGITKLQAAHPGKAIKPIILWHQGESDAPVEERRLAYLSNLTAMVNKIRAHDALLAAAPLVITKLYYRPDANETAINDALQAYADANANAYIIDISDTPRKQDLTTAQKGGYTATISDDEHNSYIGQVAKGERIFSVLESIDYI